VNFERRIVTVSAETAKSRKTRHIPLNVEAYETLKSWRAQCDLGNSRVFESDEGKRFDNVNSSWHALLGAARIEDFRWHDMRHHFASRLAMGCVDLNTIRELLGHSDYAMTLRYAHLAPEHRLDAVEVLDRPRPHLTVVAADSSSREAPGPVYKLPPFLSLLEHAEAPPGSAGRGFKAALSRRRSGTGATR
jgi:integrase